MDPHVTTVFKSEVRRQSKFALMAADDLKTSLEQQDQDRIWYAIQVILVSVGNLSKLFWPSKTRTRDDLREEYSLSDDSAIAPRNFRNHFEHFDERIEAWANSSSQMFIDSNVAPPGMISGIDSSEFLRNFDPESYAVTFRGDLYPLKPVLEEVNRIHEQV